MINIVKDKEPIWEVEKYDVVLIGTTIYNNLNNGFQSKMRAKYPFLDAELDKTPYADRRKLGTRITVHQNPIISILFVSRYPNKHKVTLDFNALENALSTANAEFRGKKVLTTLIGTTLYDGNAPRDKVLELMERCCRNMDVDVYDYYQIPKRVERAMIIEKIRKVGESDPEKFKELWKQREAIMQKLYLLS